MTERTLQAWQHDGPVYPHEHKPDGRRVRIRDGQRDAGMTGTLLYFHNGAGLFNRWVARVAFDDFPYADLPDWNVDALSIEEIPDV